MNILLLAFAAASPAAEPAASEPAAPQAAAEEVRIPFPNRATIRNFRPVGTDTLYLQDQRRNWYKATLVPPCFDLPGALSIGFDTWGSALDNTSTVIVGNERCRILSLVRSGEPPREGRRARARAD
jgi:hypothetical protein